MNILARVTRRTLLKNRTRTIVTVIGVILSVAMVTAITTFIASMQDFLLRSVILDEGDWQASVQSETYAQAQELAANDAVAEAGLIHPVGSALLEGSANADKPYLYVQALDEAAFSLRGITAIEGRLPENDSELLIAEHIHTNGGVTCEVGQTLTLQVGERVYDDGYPVAGNAMYDPDGSPEGLRNTRTKIYTVVGICARPDLEAYSAGGYSVFTRLDPASLGPDSTVDVPLKLKNPAAVFEVMPRLADEMDIRYHANLLRYMGISANDSFNTVLYSMAAILIVLIMVGSVSLIYNAFAISVSERSRQFGMLSSAGATSRQIRHSVFYEAFLISGVGIPLGLLAGVGGIGVTLLFLGDTIVETGVLGGSGVDFKLVVSVPALVIAAVIGLATVLISAWIPSRRAARMSAMDAIRQTQDIRLRARQVKTSRLTRRLFGMEGELALKNFKRNRRRYRATVFSLFISVVLFVSVSAYTGMLRQSAGVVYDDTNFDLKIGTAGREESTGEDLALSFLEELRNLDEVEQASMLNVSSSYILLPAGVLSAETREVLLPGRPEELTAQERESLEALGWQKEEDLYELSFQVVTLDDETFDGYLKELGLDKAAYTDPANPRGIVLDRFVDQNQAGQYVEGYILSHEKPLALTLSLFGSGMGNQVPSLQVTASAFVDSSPLGLEESVTYPQVRLLVSRQVMEACAQGYVSGQPSFAVSAADPDKAETAVNQLIDTGYSGYYCFNAAAEMRETRNILLVIDVLCYGFITLISLITVANVFNTISTNVGLRRREFAMLKSVGMTPRGFDKMMNFECLFYGIKALLYGIPVSLAVAWLIQISLSSGVQTVYSLPWAAVGIAALMVFLVVFITMLYAMSKVRRENIVDALKNENL